MSSFSECDRHMRKLRSMMIASYSESSRLERGKDCLSSPVKRDCALRTLTSTLACPVVFLSQMLQALSRSRRTWGRTAPGELRGHDEEQRHSSFAELETHLASGTVMHLLIQIMGSRNSGLQLKFFCPVSQL